MGLNSSSTWFPLLLVPSALSHMCARGVLAIYCLPCSKVTTVEVTFLQISVTVKHARDTSQLYTDISVTVKHARDTSQLYTDISVTVKHARDTSQLYTDISVTVKHARDTSQLYTDFVPRLLQT